MFFFALYCGLCKRLATEKSKFELRDKAPQVPAA